MLENPNDIPKERDWYLVLLREKDTGFILIPKVGDYIGKKTNGTNAEGWAIANCTDSDFSIGVKHYYSELCEVIAWRELPDIPENWRENRCAKD